MPHFKQQSMEHRSEKRYGPSRLLFSLDGEKSQDGSRTSRDHPKPQWKGLSINSGLSAQLPSWLRASWNPCLRHPCVSLSSPPQPVGSWGSGGNVRVPCGRSSDPPWPSHLLPMRTERVHEENILSRHITHFIFIYFTLISLASNLHHLPEPFVDDLTAYFSEQLEKMTSSLHL